MKKIYLIMLGFLLAQGFARDAHAQEKYKIDPTHVSVVWFATHFNFSHPSGKFARVEGEFTIDEKNPNLSYVTATVYTDSLITGFKKFDDHIMSSDFLYAGKFPQAVFVSEKIEMTGEKMADIHGSLTMLGITRPLVLHAKLNRIGENPANNTKTAGFSMDAVIKRSEYGINYALPGVADEVALRIEVEGKAE
ncbi:MAG: YceI family protein [Pseudomonadota bacterium]